MLTVILSFWGTGKIPGQVWPRKVPDPARSLFFSCLPLYWVLILFLFSLSHVPGQSVFWWFHPGSKILYFLHRTVSLCLHRVQTLPPLSFTTSIPNLLLYPCVWWWNMRRPVTFGEGSAKCLILLFVSVSNYFCGSHDSVCPVTLSIDPSSPQLCPKHLCPMNLHFS